MKLNIAVYQGTGVQGDVARALAVVRRVVTRAAARGARLAVFPELFVCGYGAGAAVTALAEPAAGPSAEAIAAIADRTGVAILVRLPGTRRPPDLQLGAADRRVGTIDRELPQDPPLRRVGAPGVHARGHACDGDRGRAEDRDPDLLRCRVPRVGAGAGPRGGGAGGCPDRPGPTLRHRGAHARAGPGLRKPGLPGLRRPLRGGGRSRVLRPVLHRRPGRKSARPGRPASGAFAGRNRHRRPDGIPPTEPISRRPPARAIRALAGRPRNSRRTP